jgi:hypothetical protein
MLSKREIAITLFKLITALFLVVMFYNTTVSMILSNEKELFANEIMENRQDSSEEVKIDKKYIGINVKNIKGPSFSLYFLAVFLGLAWNVKKVMKIGIC